MTHLRSISQHRKTLAAGSILGISALLLAACGQPPEEGSSASGENKDYKGCIVSDSGGFDDRSFNQSSYEGLMKVKENLGISTAAAESKAQTDFETNINQMVQQNCDMVITVGFLISDATKAAAAANPNTHFTIVDDSQIEAENVRPIVYDTSQAAFLAGYTAAAQSTSGKVATYGGVQIPTVTIFMDGFAEGVKYYNEQKGADVQVLGWDSEKQNGTFTGDFVDTAKGKTITKNFLNEGADVIMPVAGPVGSGTVDAVTEHNEGREDPATIVWVDSDGYQTVASGKEYILTSVVKKMGEAVARTIKDDLAGEFTNEPYVGTLENDGVALADFHEQADEVSEETKKELEQIKQKIIDGEITVNSPASPLNH